MVIVLANDDADFLAVVAYALRRRGHEVIESPASPAAFVRWYLVRPDAVVLDVLGQRQGLAALESIRRLHATIPIVLSTVSRDAEHIAELRQRGATAVLVKPYLIRQLVVLLEGFKQGARDDEPFQGYLDETS